VSHLKNESGGVFSRTADGGPFGDRTKGNTAWRVHFDFTLRWATSILRLHEPTISFPEARPRPDPLPQGEGTPSVRLDNSDRFGACAMCGPTIGNFGNCGLLESTFFNPLDGDVLAGRAAMLFGPGG